MSTRSLVTTALVVATLGIVSPAYAQETAASGSGAVSTLVQWSVITAGFALAIAAAFGALVRVLFYLGEGFDAATRHEVQVVADFAA